MKFVITFIGFRNPIRNNLEFIDFFKLGEQVLLKKYICEILTELRKTYPSAHILLDTPSLTLLIEDTKKDFEIIDEISKTENVVVLTVFLDDISPLVELRLEKR